MTGTLGFGTLFFANNPKILHTIVVVSHFFLTTTAILGIYVVSYTFFPWISSRLMAVFPLFSGVMLIILSIVQDSKPFLDRSGVIDFNMSRPVSVLLSYLLFFGIGSVFVIFTRLLYQAKSYEVRIISFVMSVFAFLGILNAFFRYLLPESMGSQFLRTGIYDTVHILTGVAFISLFALPPIILLYLSKNKNRREE